MEGFGDVCDFVEMGPFTTNTLVEGDVVNNGVRILGDGVVGCRVALEGHGRIGGGRELLLGWVVFESGGRSMLGRGRSGGGNRRGGRC